MLQQENEEEVKKMKQVFVSYHYTANDHSVNGFGNYIGQFNPENYENDLRSFILDLQQEIGRVFEDQTGIPCSIKIMFWR